MDCTMVLTREHYFLSSDTDDMPAALATICHYRPGATSHRRPASMIRSERRNSHREHLLLPFYLVPLQRDGDVYQPVSPHSLLAISRDVSPRGLGFHCDVPLEPGHFLAEFDSLCGSSQRFIVEIRWVRKRSDHCYLGGGQFLGLARDGG